MPLLRFKALTVDVVGTLIDFERGMLDYLHQVAPASNVLALKRWTKPASPELMAGPHVQWRRKSGAARCDGGGTARDAVGRATTQWNAVAARPNAACVARHRPKLLAAIQKESSKGRSQASALKQASDVEDK